MFALFFLNLPHILMADFNTKQTNQQPQINVLSAGLVVSSMTQQQKQTAGAGRCPHGTHQRGLRWEG